MLSEFFFFLDMMGVAFGATWFVILPIALHFIFRSLWGRYLAIKYLTNQEYAIIELIPPREVEKSPKLMEGFFEILSGTFKGPDVFEQYVKGYVNPGFSLEIVGTAGEAHFYISMPLVFRDIVESALYAQYPDIEIVVATDYVSKIPAIIPNKEWTLYGNDFKLKMPDAYPIKTYKYFQEDVTGKMIDPMSSLLELMAGLPPGQHLWLQYIITAEDPTWFERVAKPEWSKLTGRDNGKKGSFWTRFWKDLMDVVLGVASGWNKPVEFSPFEESTTKDEQPIEFRLTPGEKQVLTALEQNIAKPMFNVKMRQIYSGRIDGFSKVRVFPQFMGVLNQFSDNHLNAFLIESMSKTKVDYVFKKSIIEFRQRKILRRYRDRDDSGHTFHLSSEELATVFHMPDMSVVSPSLRFVDSRRGGAPVNLPLQ